MIVITILVIITPKNDLVEQRTEYEHGFDQDRIEGNSIQILMPAIEEEHHYHQEIGED